MDCSRPECWSYMTPRNKNPSFHTYTEHRPHAAPKGQEETLIRGREDSSESETASVGAKEPQQARPSWALKDSPLHLQHRHCTQTGKPWGLSAGEVGGGTPGSPCSQKLPGFWTPAPRSAWQSCIQPLLPTSTVAIFRQNSGG